MGISLVMILGKRELEEKKITIKDMNTESQEKIPLNVDKIVDYIKNKLKK